jgi:hypothetical protein
MVSQRSDNNAAVVDVGRAHCATLCLRMYNAVSMISFVYIYIYDQLQSVLGFSGVGIFQDEYASSEAERVQ